MTHDRIRQIRARIELENEKGNFGACNDLTECLDAIEELTKARAAFKSVAEEQASMIAERDKLLRECRALLTDHQWSAEELSNWGNTAHAVCPECGHKVKNGHLDCCEWGMLLPKLDTLLGEEDGDDA